MFFASDNGGPAHPQVMAAVMRANEGHALPYGVCDWTEAATALLRETFEAPEAEIALVPTGTAANAIALAAMTEPWRRVYGSDIAHIHIDEWGAPAFYSGGGEMGLVPQTHGRMTAQDLDRVISQDEPGRRGPVSITQVTEAGTVYALDALADLTRTARTHGRPVHMDGARFANAAVALDATAAQMTKGVDAVSFGATKNGCLGVEAVVVLTPDAAPSLAARRKRGGHTFSKHRYLAAQMVGYLENALWRETAQAANRKAAEFARGLSACDGVTLVHPVEANILFAHIAPELGEMLRDHGAAFYTEAPAPHPGAPDLIRLVCDWSIEDDAIAKVLHLLQTGIGG